MEGLRRKIFINTRIGVRGLSKAVNVSHTTIYSCINGKRDITMSNLYKIMKFFNDYDIRNYL